jgi:hypothetical protein
MEMVLFHILGRGNLLPHKGKRKNGTIIEEGRRSVLDGNLLPSFPTMEWGIQREGMYGTQV